MSNIISVTFDAPTVQQAQEVVDRLIRIYIAKHTQVFAGQRASGYEDTIRQTLAEQEASMAARYGANNPDLQRIRMQIATLGRTMSTTSNARTSTAAAPSPLRQQVEQEIVMDNAQLAPLEPERTRYEALVASLGTELSRLEEADLALRTLGAAYGTY